MKGRSTLVLLEQVVMLLVFALAAALCLQAFALSDRISEESAQRDRAVLWAQNTVEVLKDCAGDPEAAAEKLGAAWDGEQLVCENGELQLCAVLTGNEGSLLGTATVTVTDGAGRVLIQLPAAWQEADIDG